MGREASARDFGTSERMKNGGILDLFPIFRTARLGQKIRRSPQSPLKLCFLGKEKSPLYHLYKRRFCRGSTLIYHLCSLLPLPDALSSADKPPGLSANDPGSLGNRSGVLFPINTVPLTSVFYHYSQVFVKHSRKNRLIFPPASKRGTIYIISDY